MTLVLPGDRGHPALVAEIMSRIAERGPLPFAEFMAAALYHPRYGYYVAGEPVGYGGDFYTSPEVHPAFGCLLAWQVIEMWERLDRPEPFDVVEVGGGSGALADAVLSQLARVPGAGEAMRYTIVEASPALRLQQQRRLGRWADGRRSRPEPALAWSEPAGTAFPLAGIVGCVLANELLDALPVHRVTVAGGQLREVVVGVENGQFVERLADPNTPRLAAYFADLGLLPAEGAIAEVSLAMLDWVAAVAHALDRGWLLVIDYGYPAHELFAPARRRGTLQCHFRHTLSENPYRRVGLQDITAHVDLTSLTRQATAGGLLPVGGIRQRDFLLNLGIAEYAEAIGRRGLSAGELARNRRALADLVAPDGLGAFWVVGMVRNAAPELLAGFGGGTAVRTAAGASPALALLPSAFEAEFPELAEMWRQTFGNRAGES
ncbi:MAG: SAM-dependent methyltransferase [Chloroflexi bacterium]|nr:SAM-dependent methyltransferase [Chloroflexota bacterium]